MSHNPFRPLQLPVAGTYRNKDDNRLYDVKKTLEDSPTKYTIFLKYEYKLHIENEWKPLHHKMLDNFVLIKEE